MSYPQNTFPGPYMQALQSSPTVGLTPPPWAIEIVKDIKTIKSSVAKIEKIERTVDRISTKIDNLESIVKSMEIRMEDSEKGMQFINKEFGNSKKLIQTMKGLFEQCKRFETVLKSIEAQNESLLAKTEELEFRSMRKNLLFQGIKERDDENCEVLVKKIINEKLGITKDISFDRAHGIGRPITGKCRPIVVKFHNYKQREIIRKAAQGKKKNEALKAENQRVGVQQTKQVLQKRSQLYPIMDRE